MHLRPLSAALIAACSSDDPMMVDEDIAAVPSACAAGRVTDDRADDHRFDQIRVLYVTPSDGADVQRDTNGQICNSVRAFATWFTKRSGVYLRFDTADTDLDIGFVRLAKTDVEMKGNDPGNATIENGIAFVRERIERELEQRGLIAPNKLYAVYYEGSSSWACGAGAWPPLISDRVGVMYLKGVPFGTSIDCGANEWGRPTLEPGYIDYAILHELVHTLGFVPDAAPHEHSYGHLFEPGVATTSRDLMYSPRPQMNDPAWGIFVDDGPLLDVNNGDYFKTPNALDLSTGSVIAPLPANAQRPIGW